MKLMFFNWWKFIWYLPFGCK